LGVALTTPLRKTFLVTKPQRKSKMIMWPKFFKNCKAEEGEEEEEEEEEEECYLPSYRGAEPCDFSLLISIDSIKSH